MRALRTILLILAVLLGQSHLCRAVYVTPEGRDCPSCPSVSCPDESVPKASSVKAMSVRPKDCRACCRLTCREVAKAKSVLLVPSPETMDATLESAALLLPIRALIVRENIRYRVAAQYANPPPSHSDSRAPPASFA